MTLSTQPYKGARDFYPEDKRLQKYMFGKMREVAERFGYEEYDAPVLEPLELYLAKTGEEIVSEQTYAFEDRGGRKVALRPEMTPTVSRLVAAKRQELAYPVRLFNIGARWRYERQQRGRYREFYQLDLDIFGVDGTEAEHEIIQVANQILKSYGAKPDMYSILLNSRKLVEELLGNYLGLDHTQTETVIRLIDRMKKMEPDSFMAQADAILTPSQREKGVLDSLLQLLKAKKLEDLPSGFEVHPSVIELKRLAALLDESRVTNHKFDVTLMRGFDYYTDIVFEVFDLAPENNRSMFGGGRYDGLVGLFGVESVPTVGFAMGDATLQNFLESHDLVPTLHPETDAYVVLIGDGMYEKAQSALAEFRKMGLNLAVDTTNRKIDKQIKTAVKKGLHYTMFIGDEELGSGQYKLRNLADGSEETHGAQRIVSIVKDRRHANEQVAEADDEDIDMTAPNHALTGALIGLTVANPILALPLAFLSHFACDAIPHYDPPETNQAKLFRSKRFIYEFLVAGAILCCALVVVLALARPRHWVSAAICAFLATSPDLFWLPRFVRSRRSGKDETSSNWFLRLHHLVQWKTGPKLIWLEAIWFMVFGALVLTKF